VGDGVRKLLQEQKNGELVVLENCASTGEEGNDRLRRALASLCEVYVGESFGCAHRALASTVGMVPHVPGPRVAGLRLKQELAVFERLLTLPARPFVAAVGGEKPSTSCACRSLVPRVDALLLGGAVATPSSRRARSRWARARPRRPGSRPRGRCSRRSRSGVKLLLPGDHVCLQDGGEASPAEGGRRRRGGAGGPARLRLGPRLPPRSGRAPARAPPSGTARWAVGGPALRRGHPRHGRALAGVQGLSVACGAGTAEAIQA
jgi:hypothetical protein